MITFTREGVTVKCNVSDGNGWNWNFTIRVDNDATAEIIKKHFENKYYKDMEGIKKRFYLLGYADGKNKKRKMW